MPKTILVLVALATLCCHLIIGENDLLAQGNSPQRPNIILVNLDDADTEQFTASNINRHFPAIAELYRRSTVFTNAHCTTPFCAPSRAALMTGKYAFNNGCKTNSDVDPLSAGFEGGYGCFLRGEHDENELGVWMKNAGYRTMHVGKYHHDGFDFATPAGWDDFSVTLGAKYYGAARFSNINRNRAQYYELPDDQYITYEELRECFGAINSNRALRPNTPFFLYIAPIAPHSPQGGDFSMMAEPKYRNYEEGLLLPTSDPNYDESDLSDKVEFLQRGPLTNSEKARLQGLFIHRLRALKSVDDMIGRLVDRLKETGQWENTYFFLTSDNGFSMGQHRIKFKKEPYESGSGVPLFVRPPSSNSQRQASHLIAHLDICPTILELAGGRIPNDLDGKSFARLINNPNAANPVTWQRSIMIENWADKQVLNDVIPMAYTAERFYDKVHIAWANGHHEYYLLRNDPFQLNSRYGQLNGAQKQFLHRSLLNFRKEDVPPTITITSPVSGNSVDRKFQFAGFMEDNSAAVMARLVVKSFSTKRFYNGNSWQDDFASIPITASSLDSNISSWKHDISIFSETRNDFDAYVSWVTPFDDSMKRGDIKFTVNMTENNSMYADISPTINDRTFAGSTQLISGFHGRYPGQKVSFFVINTNTFQYFNGQSMQSNFVAMTADLHANRRWSKTIRLPPGNYKCFAQGHFENLYQREASTAEFKVR
ncbi:sulfatase-like hydrolase/transferase [bacterium]|nr:sulfatase-like hydrolase/transferase [bacterium]